MSNIKTDEQVLEVICHSNTVTTSWKPDPTDFIESCSSLYFTTSESIVPAGNVHLVHMHGDS